MVRPHVVEFGRALVDSLQLDQVLRSGRKLRVADTLYGRGVRCVCSEAPNLLRSSIPFLTFLDQKLILRKNESETQ